jgi:putative transposase
MLNDRLGLSERRACRIIGQHRATQRYEPRRAADDAALRARLRAFSAERPRWGYRQAHTRLGDEGWQVNRKRVQRLWREEGLRVPGRKRKRQRLGESTVPACRLAAERPDQVWALDFQFDETADGKLLKLLHVLDEYTREALEIRCERRIDADETVATLERLVAERGQTPEHVRCDNGPELTANALRDWCRFSGTGASYIEPGSPWQNPYVESFGARIRDELLGVEQFSCLAEAQVMVADWRHDYNHHRPHSSLGMIPPARYAAGWRERRENGRPDSRTDTSKGRTSQHSVSISTNTPAGTPYTASAVSLQSPYGLPPRDGSTTVPPTTNPRLPLRVDQ